MNMMRVLIVSSTLGAGLLLTTGCASVEGDYKRAQMANSIIGWENFVREHPGSEYSDEAQNHIAHLRKLEEEKLAAEKKRS